MAFVVPQMPLLCDIFDNAAGPPGPARLANVPCNLTGGKRTLLSESANSTDEVYFGQMTLLLPALTDARGFETGGAGPDWIECPSGSGRIYLCLRVDDFGKGFANEHRFANITPIPDIYPWPIPIP